MKNIFKKLLPVFDVLLVPVVYPAAWLLKIVRRIGFKRLPLCKEALLSVGVFPITSHYYEPQFDHRNPKAEFSLNRNLPGIEWNTSGQLEFLKKLSYAQEL